MASRKRVKKQAKKKAPGRAKKKTGASAEGILRQIKADLDADRQKKAPKRRKRTPAQIAATQRMLAARNPNAESYVSATVPAAPAPEPASRRFVAPPAPAVDQDFFGTVNLHSTQQIYVSI